MSDTDVFFEKNPKVIREHYMGKELNSKSVAELTYEFFTFYCYDFDSNRQIINIKEGEGFS